MNQLIFFQKACLKTKFDLAQKALADYSPDVSQTEGEHFFCHPGGHAGQLNKMQYTTEFLAWLGYKKETGEHNERWEYLKNLLQDVLEEAGYRLQNRKAPVYTGKRKNERHPQRGRVLA